MQKRSPINRWNFLVGFAAVLIGTLSLKSDVLAETNSSSWLNFGGTQSQADSPSLTSTAAVQSILELPNGSVYVGEVLNHMPQGKGAMTDKNGSRQYGEWRDGNAYMITGKTVFADGTVEVGNWNADGSKCGGTITWKDGKVYKGDWKLSTDAPELPDGNGEMTWPDGRKYVGQFHDGKMDGIGKLIYPDGKVQDGSWKRDMFMGPAH